MIGRTRTLVRKRGWEMTQGFGQCIANRDYTRAIYRLSEEMEAHLRDGGSEDDESFQSLKRQWAYTCALKEFHQQHCATRDGDG